VKTAKKDGDGIMDIRMSS